MSSYFEENECVQGQPRDVLPATLVIPYWFLFSARWSGRGNNISITSSQETKESYGTHPSGNLDTWWHFPFAGQGQELWKPLSSYCIQAFTWISGSCLCCLGCFPIMSFGIFCLLWKEQLTKRLSPGPPVQEAQGWRLKMPAEGSRWSLFSAGSRPHLS